MFTDQQAKMQEVNAENEEKVKGVETKYTGEVESMNGKLAKEKTAEDDKIRELTDGAFVIFSMNTSKMKNIKRRIF